MKTLARPRDRSELLARLEQLRPDSARRWGKMSAHEMVCHLSDSYRLPLGERTASDATGPLQRTVVKWIALYLPVRWPTGIPTRPEMEQGVGGTCPTDFTTDVARLAAALTALADERLDVSGVKHPIFGRLSRRQWHRWAYLHMDHHLRQFGV
jgi:Protein of unknown function (DUF1569)